jgi:hypothetical protein
VDTICTCSINGIFLEPLENSTGDRNRSHPSDLFNQIRILLSGTRSGPGSGSLSSKIVLLMSCGLRALPCGLRALPVGYVLVPVDYVLAPVDYVLEDGKYKRAAKKLAKLWEDPVHM